ncbi:MAG: tRNA (adenosine(37)-N6)-threonylcarbamoyltransferase complex transferase subunit TsaD [Clostridia bacterium]|nr:tRNA (adenosine(37)-N6)-threonylcarbamoyltransferase complex transferase subunit TsaD [Clostridia bacterium]MBQ7907849.1 tRNA (adenosine(37)-N6)-threonylcarbamoyltransferase complex transferase subunit TsaD [Clostridia bacterium]
MFVLAFESSCDETAAAVLEMSEDQRTIKSNIVASQVDIHALYGGVVPEIASRAHIEAISKITYEALDKAGLTIKDIDLIAVTQGPGLIGALLVAVNFAKSLTFANNIPLVPVDHIKGHVAANYLSHKELKPPFLSLVVSGGHTSFFDVKSYTSLEEIASTRDDAAGECFDKIGRVMGLCYPGGAAMDKLACLGNKDAIAFPSPAISKDTLDFSFSGLKTAVVNYLNTKNQKGEEICREDVCASATKSIVEAVKEKVAMAIKSTGYKKIVLAGGVSANSHIRKGILEVCEKMGAEFYAPELYLCGDNAAMIGAQGYYEFLAGALADESLNAYPS